MPAQSFESVLDPNWLEFHDPVLEEKFKQETLKETLKVLHEYALFSLSSRPVGLLFMIVLILLGFGSTEDLVGLILNMMFLLCLLMLMKSYVKVVNHAYMHIILSSIQFVVLYNVFAKQHIVVSLLRFAINRILLGSTSVNWISSSFFAALVFLVLLIFV